MTNCSQLIVLLDFYLYSGLPHLDTHAIGHNIETVTTSQVHLDES